MADAGGGSSWEPFEIALVVLLVAGLLMRLTTGKPLFDSGETTPSTAQTAITAPTPADTCGLTIAQPHALEKVRSFITVSGTTQGCQWPSTQTVALYAQAVDAQGRPISSYTAIPPTDMIDGKTYFNTTVVLNDITKTTKGYLILVSTKLDRERSVTARIPLTFIK